MSIDINTIIKDDKSFAPNYLIDLSFLAPLFLFTLGLHPRSLNGSRVMLVLGGGHLLH